MLVSELFLLRLMHRCRCPICFFLQYVWFFFRYMERNLVSERFNLRWLILGFPTVFFYDAWRMLVSQLFSFMMHGGCWFPNCFLLWCMEDVGFPTVFVYDAWRMLVSQLFSFMMHGGCWFPICFLLWCMEDVGFQSVKLEVDCFKTVHILGRWRYEYCRFFF